MSAKINIVNLAKQIQLKLIINLKDIKPISKMESNNQNHDGVFQWGFNWGIFVVSKLGPALQHVYNNLEEVLSSQALSISPSLKPHPKR